MRGVTLLELLIALVIVSVMVTVGIPSFNSVMNNQRLTASTNEVVTAMNLAKSEAIKRVSYVTVCKSSNGTSCTNGGRWKDGWIVFANEGVVNLNKIDAGDEVIRIYPKLHDSIDVTPSGTIGNFISFRPSGTIGTNIANTSGTMTVCDERGAAYARGILVEATGRWRISKDYSHEGTALAC